MDTREIARFIRENKLCRGIFQGVFSADTLPEYPRLLICNTDPSNRPGTHWIVIYVDPNGYGEYFDSFGRPPPGVFRDYLNRHCTAWIYNRKQLQSVVSSFCGYYCCFYCLCKYKLDLPKIVACFTNDTGFNDYIVHSFVCQ